MVADGIQVVLYLPRTQTPVCTCAKTQTGKCNDAVLMLNLWFGSRLLVPRQLELTIPHMRE